MTSNLTTAHSRVELEYFLLLEQRNTGEQNISTNQVDRATGHGSLTNIEHGFTIQTSHNFTY